MSPIGGHAIDAGHRPQSYRVLIGALITHYPNGSFAGGECMDQEFDEDAT